MSPIPLNIAVEDLLTETVCKRLLVHSGRDFHVGTVYIGGGFGYLRKTINGWNNAARSVPFLLLTDLDDAECAAALQHDWLTAPRNPNLLFRVAVREVEAWLLADAENLRNFLKVRRNLIPENPEDLQDPKLELVRIASKSRSKDVRRALVPKMDSTAKQGPEHNEFLGVFVSQTWDIDTSLRTAPSLARLVQRLQSFTPRWE